MDFSSENIKTLVQLSLREDLPNGDITSELTVPENLTAKANIVAREKLVVCGLPLIKEIVSQSGFNVQCEILLSEGEVAQSEAILSKLSGKSRELLILERTILNFLQRLCGIATYTKRLTSQVSKLKILDTRKTMPGFRALDKYAVLIGGGTNHRANLSEMVLVKNNHIDAHPGGIKGALKDLFAKCPPHIPREIEVRNTAELEVAASFGPKIIMLDNFSDNQIPDAIKKLRSINPKIQVEVSGGITEDRLKALDSMGVDLVSMGSLTTKANNVDISMRIENDGNRS